MVDKEKFIDLTEASKISSKKTEEKFNVTENKINELENKLDTIQDKIDNKIENSKIKVIETLGIFVALFTFVSVEFQAFRQMNNLNSIAGMTLIMLGSLSFFVIIMDIVLNNQFSDKKIIKQKGSYFFESSKEIVQKTFGYSEQKEFNLFKCSSWGEGFKLKICLLVLCLILIGAGIYLFSLSKFFIPICK